MNKKTDELLTADKRVTIARLFDMVQISFHCGDEYEAVTLAETLLQRLKAGHDIIVRVPKCTS